MNLEPNAGDRPSALAIDRHVTGELHDDRVATWLSTDAGRAYTDGVEASGRSLGPLDIASLRHTASSTPPVANNTRWFALAGLLAAAVVLFAFVGVSTTQPSVDPTYVGVRGSALEVYQLRADRLKPYDDRQVGAGDVLGFRVDPGANRSVVLLSVDGDGVISIYYPETGDAPEPVDGPTELPGSITLDDAPGPEVFVAMFGRPVPVVRAGLERAWQTGGMEAVVKWASERGDADVAVVNRR